MSTSSINGPELFSFRSPMESFVYLESFAYLKDDDTAEPSLFQGSGSYAASNSSTDGR
jgi:hypothetical protein